MFSDTFLLLLLATVCLGRQWKNLHQKVKSFQAAPPAVADETDSGAADPFTFCAGQVVCVNWRNGGGLEPLSPASPLLLPLVHPLHLGLFDAGLDSRSPERSWSDLSRCRPGRKMWKSWSAQSPGSPSWRCW